MTFNAGAISSELTLDRRPFQSELAKAKKDAQDFAKGKYTAKLGLDDKALKAELDALKARLDLATRDRVIKIKTDTSDIDDLDKKVDQLGSKVKKAGDDGTKSFGLMHHAIDQLLPPAVTLASGLLGLSTAAVGFGIAGIAAFKGASAEIKAGTVVGQQYAGALANVKGELTQIEKTGATFAVTGFQQATRKLTADLPQLNKLTATSATNLGKVASALTGALVGGLNSASPLIVKAEGDFVSFAQTAERWATSSKATSFFDRLSTDLDHALPFLASFGTLLVHVFTAIDDVGRPMLDTLTEIGKVLDAIPVGVLTTLATTYLAFRTAVLVTAPFKAASAALLGLAASETAAAGAGGAGAGVGATRTFLGRGLGALVPVVGATVGFDFGLNQLSKRFAPTITDPTASPDARHAATALQQTSNVFKDFLTGHWSFNGALGGPSRAEQAGLQAAQTRTNDQQSINQVISGLVGVGFNFTPNSQRVKTLNGVGSAGGAFALPPGLVLAQQGANAAANARVQNSYANQYAASAGAPQSVALSVATTSAKSFAQGTQNLTDYQTQLQKSIDAEKTWTAVKDKDTVSFGKNTYEVSAYQAALKQTNGNVNQAIGLLEGHTRVLASDSANMKQAQAEQTNANDLLVGAATKYHLTTDQASAYATMLGVTYDEMAKGKITQDDFNSAVAAGKSVLDSAGPSISNLSAALQTYAASEQTAADKGALIRQTLISSQGDYLNYATTVSQAAVANQTLVTAFDAVKKGVVNAKTGMIDLKNSGAGPLLADLTALQSAAGDAAQATYDYQVSIGNAKGASKDAAAVFKSETTDALVKEYKQLHLTKDEAQKLSDLYFHWDPKVSTDVEAIGAGDTSRVLLDIADTLRALNNMPPLVFSVTSNLDANTQALFQFAATNKQKDITASRSTNADGNIFSAFANGTENHVAQIGQRGMMRVWNEPETEGEGYVPFAMSKRPRSQAITKEIARRLGGVAFFSEGQGTSDPPIGFDNVTATAPSKSGTTSASSTSKYKTLLAAITAELVKLAGVSKLTAGQVSSLSGVMLTSAKTAQSYGLITTATLKRFTAESTALTYAATALGNAETKLKTDTATYNALVKSDQANVVGGFDIGTSGNGYASGILTTLQNKVSDASKFKDEIAQAQKLGLGQDFLKTLISEGPTTAGANLQAILSQAGTDPSFIGQLNANHVALSRLGGSLGTTDANLTYGPTLAADKATIAKDTKAQLAALALIHKDLVAVEAAVSKKTKS